MVENAAAELALEDANPILSSSLALLTRNLGAISQTPVLPVFDSMRKTFDDVFYQIDKRALAAVQASEQWVRDLETRLKELAQRQSEAA